MSWKSNAGMWWNGLDGGGWHKITDHGRSPIDESYERIEKSTRMADGTLRRYTVAKKRSWTASWSNIPSTNNVSKGIKTVDGGLAGEQMENFHKRIDGAFYMFLRRGSAINKPFPNIPNSSAPWENADFYFVRVMFTDFSKTIVRRGPVDLWDISLTLEEV